MFPGAWFGIFGLRLLAMLILWGGLIFSAVWLVRAMFYGERSDLLVGEPKTARDMLDQRFIRGEITHEQYELLKGDISTPSL